MRSFFKVHCLSEEKLMELTELRKRNRNLSMYKLRKEKERQEEDEHRKMLAAKRRNRSVPPRAE